jgi:hypothetical protein
VSAFNQDLAKIARLRVLGGLVLICQRIWERYILTVTPANDTVGVLSAAGVCRPLWRSGVRLEDF